MRFKVPRTWSDIPPFVVRSTTASISHNNRVLMVLIQNSNPGLFLTSSIMIILCNFAMHQRLYQILFLI